LLLFGEVFCAIFHKYTDMDRFKGGTLHEPSLFVVRALQAQDCKNQSGGGVVTRWRLV
jgi:hypothetical protein